VRDGAGKARQKRVLAISSGGGHWVQLLRLAPAFEGYDVAYATVDIRYASQVEGHRFHLFRDATAWSKKDLLAQLWQVAVILLRERPHVVITTGASAGFFALGLARLMGARTVWLDSIANTETLSSSGRKATWVANLHLTQWPDLADGDRVQYKGAVL